MLKNLTHEWCMRLCCDEILETYNRGKFRSKSTPHAEVQQRTLAALHRDGWTTSIVRAELSLSVIHACRPVAWTDYPFTELGDTPGEQAPIRKVAVLSFDGDKYARVTFEGTSLEVKAAYLHPSAAAVHEAREIFRRTWEAHLAGMMRRKCSP